MNLDYLKLALSNLGHRKVRSWLTMLGIFIGIASVIALMGLGEGLRVAITSQFGMLGTDVLSVQAAGLNYLGPPGSGSVTPLTDDLADKISKLSGVDVAFNRYIETGIMEFNNKQEVGFAGSSPIGTNRAVFERMLNLKTVEGRMLKDGDGKRVVLGNSFKTNKDIFDKTIKVGDKIKLKGVQFEVIGILEKKGSFLFDNLIMINEDALLDSLRQNANKNVNVIAVKVKDVNKVDEVKVAIEKLLRKERNVKKGEENFEVSSPKQMLQSLDSVLGGVNLFVFIIAAVSLVVGGIGIMNTMYTAVLERTKEIGVMKSIGAKNSMIFTLFFFESGLLGLVGGIIGVSLGVLIAYGTAFLGRLALQVDIIQAHVTLDLIIGSLLFAFLLGIIFGVLPAYQASKLQPVESLRSTN